MVAVVRCAASLVAQVAGPRSDVGLVTPPSSVPGVCEFVAMLVVVVAVPIVTKAAAMMMMMMMTRSALRLTLQRQIGCTQQRFFEWNRCDSRTIWERG